MALPCSGAPSPRSGELAISPLRFGGDGCRSADDQRTILGPVPCSLSRCLPHSVTLLRARRQRLRILLRPIGNFAASSPSRYCPHLGIVPHASSRIGSA